MNLRFLLPGVLLAVTSAVAQNQAPAFSTPIQNLTMRPTTGPVTIALANNFSDPDLRDINGTQVRITTTLGVMNLELFDANAPATVANFLRYISSGRYTANMFWHRSVQTPTPFVIQTGGYVFNTINGGSADAIVTFPPIQNEFSVSNVRGTVAMSLTGGDTATATSQWYINESDANAAVLDPGRYTVFGRVIEGGMSVVDAIAAVPVFSKGSPFDALPLRNYADTTPVQPVTLANLILLTGYTVGPKMTFAAQSNNSGIVNPVINGTKLTLTPNLTGMATVTVTATDFSGATATGTSTVNVSATAPFGKLANIATRARVGLGENVLIGGFVVRGTGVKRLLIRTLGPELTASGVPDVLADPSMQIYQGSTVVQQNDNWKSDPTQQALIAATPFAPRDDREPAILFNAAPGNYTVVVNGVGSTSGNALIEIYELDAADSTNLIDIATRGNVGTGGNVMIGGFVIGGTTPKRVIVRAVGPSLAQAGVVNPLANPSLLIYANSTLIAQNDNWATGSDGNANPDAAAITASGFQPTSAQESAVIVTLAPGPYTAIVSGVNGTTGVALVEVYDLD